MTLCENKFCLLWDDGYCIMEGITHDEVGRCNDCVYVEIEKEVLETARKPQLEWYSQEVLPKS